MEGDGNLRHTIGDACVGFQYVGEKADENYIWLYRTCWIEYQETDQEIRRTFILLGAEGKGPSDWYIGVLIPKSIKNMTRREKERRESLIGALATELDAGSGSGNEHWLAWWDWVDDKWKDWNPLLPELQRESEDDEGG